MTDTAPLDAALTYSAAGWPVFPCGCDKRPLTPRGYKDATTDSVTIAWWWCRWPSALIGTPTGRTFVVLDVDVHQDTNGFTTLAALGVAELPATPTVRSRSGGRHFYFAPPEPPIGCTVGATGRGIGLGLDWRGVGGYVILPAPGTGYEWVSDTATLPLARVPPTLMPKPAPPEVIGTAARCDALSPYGRAALASAAGKILTAPNGEQEVTLNGQAYSIGRLAGCGGVPAELALKVLLTAARALPSYDVRRPWRPGQAEAKVHGAFKQGLARPRATLEDLIAEMDRGMADE